MSEAVRRFRHTLLNHVNHILGYAELLLEESNDGPDSEGTAGAGLAASLDEIRTAGRQILAEVIRLTDAAPAPAGELRQALAAPLGRLGSQAEALAASLPHGVEAAQLIGHIAAAARQAQAVADTGWVADSIPGASAAIASRSPEHNSGVFPSPEGSDRSHVLIVDDDQGNRDLLARRLQRLGYAVHHAADGKAAIELLGREKVDLMLLDIDMPGLNGYDVLEARQGDSELRDVPTIMISASADLQSVVRCIHMGADDHLGKPFDPVLLEARVGACLERKRLQDHQRELLATISLQAAELAELNITLEARVAEQVDELERMVRLRRFLSPQLADAVVSKGEVAVLQSHRRDIAVLFVDLSGFTPFSETSEPEDVMTVLREFHRELGRFVEQFGATVGFFAGDGLMVFFNDPLPCPNPAGQAVRMAVAMRERLGALSQAWRKRGHDLGFAIGIASGYATLGEIGFEGRYDYGVIGSVVNLASRLCDHAERDQILISARAKVAVEDEADLAEIGTVPLKGFHSGVPVFSVSRLREPT